MHCILYIVFLSMNDILHIVFSPSNCICLIVIFSLYPFILVFLIYCIVCIGCNPLYYMHSFLSMHWIILSASQSNLFSILYALYYMHCIKFIVFYELYSIYCILCIVLYAMYNMQYNRENTTSRQPSMQVCWYFVCMLISAQLEDKWRKIFR